MNSIYPGLIDTPMQADTPIEQLEEWRVLISLKRPGKAEEAATACLFLMSNAASYISGAELNVCGASTAERPSHSPRYQCWGRVRLATFDHVRNQV